MVPPVRRIYSLIPKISHVRTVAPDLGPDFCPPCQLFSNTFFCDRDLTRHPWFWEIHLNGIIAYTYQDGGSPRSRDPSLELLSQTQGDGAACRASEQTLCARRLPSVFSALEFTVSAKWSSSCSLVQRARAFAYRVKGSADSRGSLLISSFSIDFLSGTDRHRSKVVRTSGPRWDF